MILGCALAVALAASPIPGRKPPAPVPETPSVAAAALDHSLDAPPPPPQLGAKVLVISGLALVFAGIAGGFLTPHCRTPGPRGGCVDPQGPHDAFPALIVGGLAVSITGSYWLRQDR